MAMRHMVPGAAVRLLLEGHGVDSVNTAVEWAALHATPMEEKVDRRTGEVRLAQPHNSIVPSAIVTIVRGRREGVMRLKEDGQRRRDASGVPFELADRIAIALGHPWIWYREWAPYYVPDGERSAAFDAVVTSLSGAIFRAAAIVRHENGLDGVLLWPQGEDSWVVLFAGEEEARVVPRRRMSLLATSDDLAGSA